MNWSETLCFSPTDLQRFGEASHDRNPLHLSADYARKSPYGGQVVFGILGGLACLARLGDRPEEHLTSLTLDFPGAMLVGIPYQIEVKETAEKAIAKLYDGRRLLLKLTARFEAGTAVPIELEDGSAPRLDCRYLVPDDLKAGSTVSGQYAPSRGAFDTLVQSDTLVAKGISPAQLAALLWASYLVGMELPGQQALFSKLSIQFETVVTATYPGLEYTAAVTSFDDRFNLLQTQARLTAGNYLFAKAEIRAFVRPASPVPRQEKFEQLLPASLALQNKVALIIGGSRGLGAAIAQALVSQGCTVFVNFYRSLAEAEALAEELAEAPGKLKLLQGNAADLGWCQTAQETILQTYGRLDFLICNACPPILPLWLEPSSIERVNQYVAQSLGLMSVPMSVFLESLAASGGRNIVISSVYASQAAPADLPHYVAAKYAVEGLVKAAASEYEAVSHLIVRPPKLLTDQTNTPLSSQGAIALS
ncbi:MAG: SDR family NAD(P)-dependent oxidoreductase [Leptolyngbyaceae cyanobacterium SM1_1_3]|nr:SDR family NAD(P)-dependent oxidoreductase [Leptolyngbyaceae cyanobacterium SM1_1_3]